MRTTGSGKFRSGGTIALLVSDGPGVEVRPEMAEQRAGIGPDTSDLDEQIKVARTEKEAAIEAQDFEQAASKRDREKQLLAAKAARQKQWAAEHPAPPDLAEQCRQLAAEVERLRALLRQHGIDPQDADGDVGET